VKLPMKAVAPVGLLLLVSAVTAAMFASRSGPETTRPEVPAPLVHTITARSGPVKFTVEARGTVSPRTESDVVTEISGRITWVSPQLMSGAFFSSDDTLIRIDTRDYEANLESARAALARSQSQLELARATLARERSMRKNGAASKAQLDTAIHDANSAEAGLREARVAVRRAETDLERCELRAPFDGRVREKHVDVGQFVGRGERLARIYSVDYAEIRLPIPDERLAYLDLPIGFRTPTPISPSGSAEPGEAADSQAAEGPVSGPAVRISARFAGRTHIWKGRVVRTEGALDPKTRMVTAVVRIDDPYGRGDDPNRPPLAVGLFVEAEIDGIVMNDLIEIPRGALRGGNRVAVVSADDRIDVRVVEIARTGAQHVWIRSGVEEGERISVSPLSTVVSGMLVRSEAVVHTAASSPSQP
jgi:RND family efflux transporter MFP subunit